MFACCHPALSAGSANRAGAENPLRIRPGRNREGVPDHRSGHRETTDPRPAKNSGAAHSPLKFPAGEEFSPPARWRPANALSAFQRRLQSVERRSLIREELCREAIRLATLLAEHPAGNQPRTHALIALMLLNAARLPARMDAEGNILRLKEQDRSNWDQTMIARGMFTLEQSAAGDELSVVSSPGRDRGLSLRGERL